ncbi:MAG: glycosyltransferase family A protein [Chthoniobacterales bacterium]
MAETVSIIIPCYNAARWLAETLDSALAQTWKDTEIIVVDDGSKDDSLTIARSYESRGVHVVAQANQGASAARNAGLLVSKGDFIQFLDADDALSENKIELQILALHQAGEKTLASCAWGEFKTDFHDATFIPQAVWQSLTPVE